MDNNNRQQQATDKTTSIMIHSARIITSTLLSLLVVILGGGLTVLRCEHSGNVEIAQLHSGGCDSDDSNCGGTSKGRHCHAGTKPCMQHTLLKLATAVQSSTYTPVPNQPSATIWLPYTLDIMPEPRPTLRPRFYQGTPRHGPPRLWLAMIRVLII